MLVHIQGLHIYIYTYKLVCVFGTSVIFISIGKIEALNRRDFDRYEISRINL